jgi:arabinofuranosyltransferase
MRAAMRALKTVSRPQSNIFLLTALLCGSILRLAVASYTSDDAYISFTYARNLAHGEGLAFNPGEHVYGFTNPGWTVLISVFFRTLPDEQAIIGVKLLALVFSLSTALLLYRLARSRTGSESIARLITLLWIWEPWEMAEAMNGLETPVYAFFLLASLWLFLDSRWSLGCCALGVATLMRPEAALLFLFVLAGRLIKRGSRVSRDLAHGVAAFGLVVLPWYAYAYRVYGTLLPNSFFTRANLSLVSFRHTVTQLAFIVANYFPLCLMTIWWLLRQRDKKSRQWIMTAFISWSVAMMSYYVVIPSYIRYLVGPSLILLFYFAEPLTQWVQDFACRATNGYKPFQLMIALVLGFLIVRGTAGSLANLYFYNLKASGFEDIHVYTGQWIAENTSPDTVIAAHDVGALGFYSHRYILDTTGLVSGQRPGASKQLQEWLRSEKPDYLSVCLNWVDSFPSTLGCKLTPVLVRQGHISFRTPDAVFVLYQCGWHSRPEATMRPVAQQY